MRLWTINNVPIGDLGIDTLLFNVQNQDDDYVEIRFKRNYDAALPEGFDVGETVVVRYGQRVVFRGEIEKPVSTANSSMEAKSVIAYGPWHRFASMPFLYLYPYVTGSALSTHGVIGGDANTLITTILQTNAADVVQVGHVDVGTLTIPETEVYDQKLTETLQSILRYVPGALVLFDYATDPPTIHVVADNSTHLQSVLFDPADGRASDFRLNPLYERLVEGVTLQYEATGDLESAEQQYNQTNVGNVDTVSSPTVQNGFFILGTDSAGDAASRRHFRRTIRLEGAYDVSIFTLHGQLWPFVPNYSSSGGIPFTLADLTTPVPDSGTTRKNKLIMVDRAMFFRMFYDGTSNFTFNLGASSKASSANAGSFSSVTGEWFSDSTGAGAGFSSYMRPLMRAGGAQATEPSTVVPLTVPNLCKWKRSLVAPAFLQTASVAGLRAYGWTGSWGFTNTSGEAGSANQTAGSDNEIVFLDARTVGAIDSVSGRFAFVKTVNNSTTDVPALGIAAQILDANGRLLYEGGSTALLERDPARFFGLSRKVQVVGLGVSTVLQRFTLDVSTGLASMSFGAPVHLGPQDLISLYRAGIGSA